MTATSASEDLIAEEDVVVTITRTGYAKRTKTDLYRAQRRGGKGVQGAAPEGGRHRRALLRHVDHTTGCCSSPTRAGSTAQGLRAAGGQPQRPRPARGQPAGLPTRRNRSPTSSRSVTTRSRRTWCWRPGQGWSRRPSSPISTRTGPAASSPSTCARTTSSSTPRSSPH